MHWLAITISARFLNAFGIILDKFLLTSKKVSHPSIYAFYSGILSSFVLVFIPFGFSLISFGQIFLSFFSGIIFIYGVLLLFFAIKENEASQVMPAVGAIIPIVTYFLSLFLFKESLNVMQVIGVFVLILGGLLISYDAENKNGKNFFSGFYQSIGSGILLAIAFAFYKILYQNNNFLNIFVWTRFGLILGALSLFFIRPWRKMIFKSLANFKKPKKEHVHAGWLFLFTKTLNGLGSILLNYAIAIGSVTVVNALVSLEYAFLFLMGFGFAEFYPKIFKERKDFRSIAQKVLSLIIISAGIFLVSKS